MRARRTGRSAATAGRMRKFGCMAILKTEFYPQKDCASFVFTPQAVSAIMRAPSSSRGEAVRKWIASCALVALLFSGAALRGAQSAGGTAQGTRAEPAVSRQTETD